MLEIHPLHLHISDGLLCASFMAKETHENPSSRFTQKNDEKWHSIQFSRPAHLESSSIQSQANRGIAAAVQRFEQGEIHLQHRRCDLGLSKCAWTCIQGPHAPQFFERITFIGKNFVQVLAFAQHETGWTSLQHSDRSSALKSPLASFGQSGTWSTIGHSLWPSALSTSGSGSGKMYVGIPQ